MVAIFGICIKAGTIERITVSSVLMGLWIGVKKKNEIVLVQADGKQQHRAS